MRRGTRTRNPQIRSLIRYPLRQPHLMMHMWTFLNHIYAIHTATTSDCDFLYKLQHENNFVLFYKFRY